MSFGVGYLFTGFIVLILGLYCIFIGKYNNSLKDENKKYNKQKQAKYGGIVLIISAVIVIIGGFLNEVLHTPNYVLIILGLLYLIVIIGGVIYIYTGKQFKI